MTEINIDNVIQKIADNINKKRREEIFHIYSADNSFWKEIRDAKNYQMYERGNKSKTMRKVASMPIEVDTFFTKVYGPDYYKDKDFFRKYHPEWSVVKQP